MTSGRPFFRFLAFGSSETATVAALASARGWASVFIFVLSAALNVAAADERAADDTTAGVVTIAASEDVADKASEEVADEASEDVADEASEEVADEASEEVADEASVLSAAVTESKAGVLLEVELPITAESSERLVARLVDLASGVDSSQRRTVVLKFEDSRRSGEEAEFESALRLARSIGGEKLRQLRTVAWVRGKLAGHAALVLMASDMILVARDADISATVAGVTSADESVAVIYQLIAKRRRLFPPAVVTAMLDPAAELSQLVLDDGRRVYVTGDRLAELRRSGSVVGEQVVRPVGAPLQLDASNLRRMRIAAAVADTPEEAADFLDLAELDARTADAMTGPVVGRRMDLIGAISPSRSRRLRSRLASTSARDRVNTWLVVVDSGGGDLDASAALAGSLSPPPPPIRRVAGFVRGEARGDAALVALACRPLWMHPDAILGGPGSDQMSSEAVDATAELVDAIARRTDRPSAILRGLLDPSLRVHRFENVKTGRIRYQVVTGARAEMEAGGDRPNWRRGDRIDLADGLSPGRAIELGLVDGEADSVAAAARRSGMDSVPPAIADSGLIRLVERIGSSRGLSFLLVSLGMACLFSELSAPGLGVPGFFAAVFFAAYFWINHLAGTAEWLELIALVLGVVFLLVEVFVLPGFGVFGVGGIALTLLGIVLMSQTFVIPRNSFQLGQLNLGLYTVIGSVAAAFGFLYALHRVSPRRGPLGGLVMDAIDVTAIERTERLADFDDLHGHVGVTTTPLRPAGKARFGDRVVGVVSDGSPVERDVAVRVIQVRGNRIVVAAVPAVD